MKRKQQENNNKKRTAKRQKKMTQVGIPKEYSFTFEIQTAGVPTLFPNLLPVEMWLAHILPYLEKDLPQLRLVCRAFMWLISFLWKNRVCYTGRLEFLLPSVWLFWLDHPQWPFRIHTFDIVTHPGFFLHSTHDSGRRSYDLLAFRLASRQVKELGIWTQGMECPQLQSCFQQLSYLTTIRVSTIFFSEEFMGILPSTVKTLFFQASGSKTNSNTRHLEATFRAIPSHVTQMALYFHDVVIRRETPTPYRNFQLAPTGLQSLCITACPGLLDDTIALLPTTLIALSLQFCHNLTNECVKRFPKNLEYLDLYQCGNVNFDRLPDISTPELRVLRLFYTFYGDGSYSLKHLVLAMDGPLRNLEDLQWEFIDNFLFDALRGYMRYRRETLPRSKNISYIRESLKTSPDERGTCFHPTFMNPLKCIRSYRENILYWLENILKPTLWQ